MWIYNVCVSGIGIAQAFILYIHINIYISESINQSIYIYTHMSIHIKMYVLYTYLYSPCRYFLTYVRI